MSPNARIKAEAAHNEALLSGRRFYCDPITGYYVQTSATLAERGNGCRHCPYPIEEQKRALRPGT